MKLGRLTVAVFKAELERRRARGNSTENPLNDVQLRREAIEAALLDVADLLVLLGATQGDIASIIARYRNELRRVGNS